MRRIILSILVFGQINFVVAQSLDVSTEDLIIYFNDTTNLGADTLDPCLTAKSYVTVKNTSNSDLTDIVCAKHTISQPLGTSNHFCWGGSCYGTTIIVSPQMIDLLSGEGNSTSFEGDFDAFCEQGSALIQYCFYPLSDPADASCITITYNGSVTSVFDKKEDFGISDFYPNPANGLTHFTFNGTNAQLEIIDILGNEVKVLHLEESGIKKIDLTDMSKGIYFGKLLIKNKVTTIKKLIVK